MPIPTKGVSPVSIPCRVNHGSAKRRAQVCLGLLGGSRLAGNRRQRLGPGTRYGRTIGQPADTARPMASRQYRRLHRRPEPRNRRRWTGSRERPTCSATSFGLAVNSKFRLPTANTAAGVLDLPLAGGSPRLSVAENNGTLPQDRVYFLYNHFQNALTDNTGGLLPGPLQQAFCVDRYTLGFEKTFLDRTWSVELRMPLAGTSDFSATDAEVTGGNVGNLAIVVKHLIYESDTAAAAIGLGIDTPTGSDVHGQLFATDFAVHNQAVCLVPYIAFLKKPGEDFFCQGFLSLNVPTNGNRIAYRDPVNGWSTLGTLNESTFLQLDLEAGRWFYRNPDADIFTGLASVVELHYTTTLQDADHVGGTIPASAVQWQFGDVANRADILDLTVGLHGEFAGHTLCRVGLAVPLLTGANRGFDSELQVQIERRF